jgi:ABC-2 type transport system permease protein
VFEGMRAILVEDTVRLDLLLHALAVNAVYLAAGVALFLYSFHVARRRGLLLQVGE